METLCQGVFGTSLKGITMATEPHEQADAIVNYAVRYGLLRELADMIMHHASNRPAVQNLLLSDDMQGDAQTSSIQDQLRTLTVRMDRVLELQMAQAAENAEMQRWRNTTDQRLRYVESALPPPERSRPLQNGISMPDRAVVAVLTLLLIAMFVFTVWTARQ